MKIPPPPPPTAASDVGTSSITNNGGIRFHVLCAAVVLILCFANFGYFQPIHYGVASYYLRHSRNNGIKELNGGAATSQTAEDGKTLLENSAASPRPSAATKKGTATATKETATIADPPVVSFCLLIKDDNDILSEWVAYHYHVMNMRRLIVAIDPDSETTPDDVLKLWGRKTTAQGGSDADSANDSLFDLDYTLWNDEDYMPEYFWKDKDYKKIPNYLGKSRRFDRKTNRTYSDWHTMQMLQNMTEEEVVADLERVNNHRFRQRKFVAQCYARLKREGRTWTAHIDTDEFMVVNPILRRQQKVNSFKNKDQKPEVDVNVPLTPSAGSLVKFLVELYSKMATKLPRTCLMMPTLRFGSKEDTHLHMTLADDGQIIVPSDADAVATNKNVSSSSPLWRYESLESLRWEYHGNFTNNHYNGKPKSLVNIATIPKDHPIFRDLIAHSIHEPLNGKDGCMMNVRDFEPVWSRPITTNHYLGSYERYMARGDVRRNARIYGNKAERAANLKDDGWIRDWFHQFVNDHGVDKVLTVLRNHTISAATSALPSINQS